MWNVDAMQYAQCVLEEEWRVSVNEQKREGRKERGKREMTIREIVAGDARDAHCAQITWTRFNIAVFG